MAEPWSRDFDALAERSRHGLRPLEAFSPKPEETKMRFSMRFFKAHPALAALFTVLAIGLVSGAAYAVVKEVWITIDPEKPADQIEQDVRSQLEQQGIHADFQAEKSDNRLKIKITTHDPSLGSDGIHVNVAGADNADRHQRLVRVRKTYPGAEDTGATVDIMSSPEVIAVLESDTLSDDEVVARLRKALADKGYQDVEIAIDGNTVQITLKAPPQTK